MSQPVKTMSLRPARGTKSRIRGDLLSVRLPRRMVPICVREPMGLASPRRMASTPAIMVVATAPRPTTITPSLPCAGAILSGVLWPPCVSVDMIFLVLPSVLAGHAEQSRQDFCANKQCTPRGVLDAAAGLHPGGSGFVHPAAASQVRPQEPHDGGKHKQDDGVVKAMKQLVKTRVRIVPAFAELHACVGKAEAPRPGAHEGVDVKARLAHLGDAGGKCDEGAHDGQQARDEDREI